jgi:hypothetical protein
MTSNEIRVMEFVNVDKAYEFYYRYANCKGFSFRKSDIRGKGPVDGKKSNDESVCMQQTWFKRAETLN